MFEKSKPPCKYKFYGNFTLNVDRIWHDLACMK